MATVHSNLSHPHSRSYVRSCKWLQRDSLTQTYSNCKLHLPAHQIFAALKSVVKRIDAAIISTQPPNPKISPTIKWHTKMTPSNVQLYDWCISIQLQNIRNQCSPGKFWEALPRKWSPETEHRYPKMIRCVKAIYLFKINMFSHVSWNLQGVKPFYLFKDSKISNHSWQTKHVFTSILGESMETAKAWKKKHKISIFLGHNKTINKNISGMILPE